MIETLRTRRHLFLVVISLLVMTGVGKAEVNERDMLLNSPLLGDFRKAKKIKEQEKVVLKVWSNFTDASQKLPQLPDNLLPRGPARLEVDYDEIWVSEREHFPAAREKKEYKGKPYLAKLYWREGRVQAFTVEKFYATDPLTWEKLSSPSYKIVAILTREIILPELAKQAARNRSFSIMNAPEHLREAKKALAEGNPEEQDLKKRTYGRLADACRHLEAIPRDAEEYGEAQQLLKEVAVREKDYKKSREVMEENAQKEMRKKREATARELDRDFLNKGMDVNIQLSGSEKTTIKLECVLFSRPMVFVLVDKSDLLKELKNVGFQKVIFSNKRIKYSWEIDLDN